MEQITTRKILSNVQQVFKPSYNRVTWELSPVTGMAVDFTKSYFCFRMYLTHQVDGSRLTAAEYRDLLSKNLMIELGQNGFSYPAAALLKVARLYSRNNTGSPLEEILYQNIFAATIHQLTEDFECIAGNTLSSGTAVSFNSNGSLAAQISSLMYSTIVPDSDAQLPVEIHIPLSDIFGICKNSHFDMSITGGLIMQIELEDVKNMFQTRSIGVPVSMPPLWDASGNGIPAQPELSPFTFLPDGQGDTLMPSYQFAKQTYDVSGNALLIAPNGYHYELGSTLQQVEGKDCLWDLGEIFTPQAAIYLQGLWTAQQMTDAKFVVGNIVKLNFRLSYPGEKLRSKMIEMYDRITSVAPSETLGQTTIGLGKSYQAPKGINSSTTTDVYLESIDVYEGPQQTTGQDPTYIRGNTFGAMIIGGVSSTPEAGITQIEDFYQYNTLSVAQVEFQELVDTGVLVVDGDGNWTGSGPFRLTMQPVVSGLPAQPWIDEFTNPDIPTQRHIYTNQGKPLAVQGTDTQILSVSAEDASGNRILQFKDLGFANNNSIQNATLRKDTVGYHAQILPPSGTYTYPGEAPSAYTLAWIVIISQSRNKNSLGLLHTDNYSFELDKCEVVLVEMTLDPSIPQNLTYETLRVEVATIETNIIDIYNRQFTVNEPSVFNVWLMTPQYSNSERLGLGAGTDPSGNHYWYEHPECLVSYARNTQQYRWAYNNIQNTNRDIEVQTNTSKYPSSLHLEKLMDTFSNTTTKPKNFSGILTVPRTACDPVVCFPLRIYEAIDPTSVYQREGGFTLQIALYGDSTHDKNIISGPIFLFKQMLKTIQG